MGVVDVETVPVNSMSDSEIKDFIKKNALALKVSECRKIHELIGRDPTLTELHMFNIEWSEHCSYKSSREILKLLPTSGPTVIQGPKEDAGIIRFAKVGKAQYGIVIAHESHNHPSQVVPYEGAATGIGGIVRDVLCMGSRVIATADPLRFGDPKSKKKGYIRYVAGSVVDGIAGYSNPIGIPNIAGDVYFNSSFDDNCLVNVVSLGIIKEEDIIHSSAPKGAEGYDIVIVGKATDNSGFGGAAFASLVLDEEEEEYNKGAVQVPDPFLKNILIRATEAVFKEVRKKGIDIGFKDMGAGGIMCASSELCESGGFGADIDVDKIHVSMKNLPPYIIACGETQERFTWISPPDFTPDLLKIYNEDFELPMVAEGAQAKVIGKVTKETDYILRKDNKVICNVPIGALTKGIRYKRERRSMKRDFKEPQLKEPSDYGKTALKILSHPNIASKAGIYKHYDTEVQGLAVIRPGEADAGMQAPIPGSRCAFALSVDHNPKYSRIDPYMGAVNAVAESMRNIAAVGAVPYGMTDCLNFGNPEVPEAFDDFVLSVEGISEAARKLCWKGDNKSPVPFVSGNVSFYNESIAGKQVDPSPIIACLGYMEDYTKAVTMKLKEVGSSIFMVGQRKDELGGSVYYDISGELGKNIPRIDLEKEKNTLYAVIDCINKGLLLSCHDISDGGLLTAISEMILGGEADGIIGADISLDFSDLRTDKVLFSESPGFIFEVNGKNIEKVASIFKGYGLQLADIGKTTRDKSLGISKDSDKILSLPIEGLKKAWTTGLKEALE
ncbi:phosphoribosylformylglycinamidine synthase subunit PurL [Candidatus Woesearchaeota archaeon]|nr:phosphoribosylformylglycinamidine synthase subunit PurL [Candidatus Woesearchaeota archaeon]